MTGLRTEGHQQETIFLQHWFGNGQANTPNRILGLVPREPGKRASPPHLQWFNAYAHLVHYRVSLRPAISCSFGRSFGLWPIRSRWRAAASVEIHDTNGCGGHTIHRSRVCWCWKSLMHTRSSMRFIAPCFFLLMATRAESHGTPVTATPDAAVARTTPVLWGLGGPGPSGFAFRALRWVRRSRSMRFDPCILVTCAKTPDHARTMSGALLANRSRTKERRDEIYNHIAIRITFQPLTFVRKKGNPKPWP